MFFLPLCSYILREEGQTQRYNSGCPKKAIVLLNSESSICIMVLKLEFYLLMDWMLLNGWHFLVFRKVWVQISYEAAYLSNIFDDFSHTLLVSVRLPHQIRL